MLKQAFINSSLQFSNNNSLIEKYWQEIEKKYSAKKRFYHNQLHLQYFLNELLICKDQIKDWDMIVFALFYHDIIYNPAKKDNEEKSAELAVQRLISLLVPNDRIEICKNHILATKSHTVSTNNDTNLFTDADLTILGSEWPIYESYYKKIRKEYSIYPEFMYNKGRKKVLEHFLKMERIFKTDFFFSKYEVQARKNLKLELNT